jgi:hypothetical protein
MAATCAACLQPITKLTGFVISGTEAFHRTCVANIARSVRTRQALEIVELRGELSNVILERDSLENDHRVELAKMDHQINRLREDLRAAESRAARAESSTYTVDDRIREQRDAAISARDQAIRERDAARAEAALHQTIQGRVVPARLETRPVTSADVAAIAGRPISPPPGDPVAPESDLDDLEMRSSLLELD